VESRPRKLVVDDNVFSRDILKASLKSTLLVTRQGQALKPSTNSLQLGLLNFEMPEMNGPETATQLLSKKEQGLQSQVNDCTQRNTSE
jgi:CheY-like chemotaxis protein